LKIDLEVIVVIVVTEVQNSAKAIIKEGKIQVKQQTDLPAPEQDHISAHGLIEMWNPEQISLLEEKIQIKEQKDIPAPEQDHIAAHGLIQMRNLE
jgi:hypothetical protein